MGFPKIIYDKAAKELASRRQRAKEMAALQREEIYTALPRVRRIDAQLAQIGMGTIRAVAAAPDQLDSILERLKNESLALQQERQEILRKAGVEEEYSVTPYSCPLCQDTGYVQSRRCSCFETLLKQTAYRQLGVSDPGQYRFSNFMLDYYSAAPLPPKNIVPRERMAGIKNFCVEYAQNFSLQSPSLLFLGGTGLGKTHLSLAIAEQVIQRDFGVVYCSAQNLLARLEKEKFSYDRDGEEDPQQQSYQSLILECDLLILDDLGTEFLTQFVTSTVYNMVNTRLIEHRPTIISTNLELGEISKRYSERLLSRLFGGYTTLEFLGRDVRVQRRMEG